MFCLLYKRKTPMKYQIIDLLCNHSSGELFTCEDNMLFSRVKISCFHVKAHLVFHWCLYNKKLFPAYTRAIFDCVVRKAYNLLTVITSSIANSPK